ncbi:hypothetical protein C0992_005719 [Termitomyces sp. T32_za158]|nr:hypothetical protein C0992_005719 [Termitomyces sp. T32_za158]
MHSPIYSLLVATLVLAFSSAHAQQLAPHPRRALLNKLQRQPIPSAVADPISAPSPTTTLPTFMNPDMAPTTIAQAPQSGSTPVTTIPAQPLSTGIPGRISPPTMLDLNQVSSDYTMISILFDEELNWPFVVSNQVSSSQIFSYIPVIIQNALSITPDEVKTYVLQVNIPATYSGPQDENQLGTLWLGFIPRNLVDTLASMIKNKNSKFYSAPNAVAQALAEHVNSDFSLNVIPALEATGSVDGLNAGTTRPVTASANS